MNLPTSLSVEKGLELRLRKEHDAQLIFDLIQKHKDYLGEWFEWVKTTKSLNDTLKFIEICAKGLKDGSKFDVGIWYEEEMAGAISFNKIDMKNKYADIGYWIRPEFQGKGIISKSVDALTNFGFDQLGLHLIEIRCAEHNIKSQAVARRAGFQQDTMLRDRFWHRDHYDGMMIFSKIKT